MNNPVPAVSSSKRGMSPRTVGRIMVGPHRNGDGRATRVPTAGWPALTAGWPWFRGEGRFPLPAYSEYMPPPRLVRKPYGEPDEPALDEADPFGWPVSEYEEALELRPGMQKVARILMREFGELAA